MQDWNCGCSQSGNFAIRGELRVVEGLPGSTQGPHPTHPPPRPLRMGPIPARLGLRKVGRGSGLSGVGILGKETNS
jgi:hypothetical protein